MNWQAFEDKMRENSGGHEIPLDTNALWEKIQQKKKRRIVPFLWWIAGFIVLGGITAGLYPFIVVPAHGTTDGESIVLQVQVEPTDNINQQYIPGEMPTAGFQSAASPKAQNVPSVVSESINNTDSPPETDKLVSDLSSLLSERINNTDSSPETNNPVSLLSENINNTVSPPEVNNILQNHAGLPEIQSTPASVELALAVIQAKVYEPGILPQLANHPANPALLPHAEQELISQKVRPTFFLFNSPKKKAKPKDWVDIGIDAGYYGWSTGRSGEPRSNEKNLESFHIGLQMKTKIAGNWAFCTGAQFNRLNAVYHWNREWDSLHYRLITSEYSDGSIDSLYSSEKTLHHYTHTVKNYNKIIAWSIPVDLQYTCKKGKWTVSPYAGLQVQFYQYSRGVINSTTAEPDKNTYPLIYKNPLVLSLRTGVRFEIPAGRFTRISITPAAIIDLTDRVNNTTYAPEFFKQYGVNMGLVRRISF